MHAKCHAKLFPDERICRIWRLRSFSSVLAPIWFQEPRNGTCKCHAKVLDRCARATSFRSAEEWASSCSASAQMPPAISVDDPCSCQTARRRWCCEDKERPRTRWVELCSVNHWKQRPETA